VKESEYFCKSTLKSRGWTDRLIELFAGNPDRVVRNPYSSQSPDMKLYLISRIEGIEQQDNFKIELEKSLVRQKRRKDVAIKTKAKTFDWVNSLPKPEFESKDKSKLIILACEHYNDLWSFRGKYDKIASPTDDVNFINRITVNYLRHACSDYEEYLFNSRGKVGANEARILIKLFILKSIGEFHPWLKQECNNQAKKIKHIVEIPNESN
jgi:hypothetical protein